MLLPVVAAASMVEAAADSTAAVVDTDNLIN
jgi:hypothetical protein